MGPVARAFGLPSWGWVSLVWFVPKFFGDGYGVDLFGKGDGDGINMRSITAMGVVGAFSCTVVKQALPTSMRASQFAACYFGGIYIASVGRDMVKHYVFNQPKREASGTDNACHLGGAVAGLAVGLVMKAAASEGRGGGGGVGGGMLLEGIIDA